MRKLATLLLSMLFVSAIHAQDISVIAITQPVSGCGLTATENVTIRIFNYGPTLTAGSSFNVSYTINGGPPVTELLTLGANLLTNSTLNYTFTTQANLSVPGSYTFDATCALPGDINPSNDAFTGYIVTNTAASVGGTVTGPASVCITGNSGNLTLAGNTGNVLRWEYSTDGGFTWINVTNTTTTQPYNNLTVPTQYRAVVQNGGCASAFSSVASIAIDPATVGGTLSPASSSRCISGNSGTITLSGHTGSVVHWEFSTDGGLTWTVVANTTTSLSYTNLTQTTIYRALVQSGTCTSAFSSNATVTVSPLTVGGAINPATTTVCAGSNSGTLTLSGHTGAVVQWQFSIDGGATWTPIANTTTTQNYLNLTVSRLYRARVQSGACAAAFSATAAVNVTSATVGGSIAPATSTVCSGTNSGTLTLSGHTGSVLQWESSTDGGVTWNVIANTTTTENYSNLTTTTMYRALVQSGGCTASYSGTSTITVDQVSVGGTVSGGLSVCSGSNSGTLTLSGQTGSVVNWQFSNDNGLTWNTITNTTTNQNFTNLTDTTIYFAIVQSGVCVSDSSAADTVFVDPVTVGGTLSPALDTVCSGNNSGTITLSGNIGSVLRWEFSTDGGNTWIANSNTTTTQAYTNISAPTLYRAVVQSGTCALAYSSIGSITINQPSVGGTLYGNATVCSGSNSGTITLIGNVGNILYWESSNDGGLSWNNIANTTGTDTYLNLVDTTIYRTIVQNGVCPADTSTLVTILVDDASQGGTVTLDDTVCSGANSGSVSLGGHVGSVDGWDLSTDGGNTWINISNTTTTQNYLNLTATTMYRARVHNGVCNSVTSSPVTITVDVPAIGGNVTGSTAVCASGNSGTLTLAGYSGTIVSWETSTDGGLTWTPNGNTTSTENYTNLTDTTWYRVIITSGVCGNDTSAVGVVTVDPVSVGGLLASNDTVCSGGNSGTIYLSGYTGGVMGWEYSTDGMNWIALTNTADSINYANLIQTTYYRAIIRNGACSPVYSAIDTITVTLPSNAGTITGAVGGCPGANGGTLVLSGYNGSVTDWLSSSDGGLTWTPVGNPSAMLTYSNLADTTWYQAIVASGTCTPDTSASAMVAIYPQPAAAFTSANVCFGSPSSFANGSSVPSGSIIINNWDFGDNNTSINVSPSHVYATADTFMVTLTVTSNFGCVDTVVDTVIVHPLPAAALTVTGSSPLCSGDSALVGAPYDSLNTYVWNTGDTTNAITVDSSMTYVLTVTSTITGCVNMDSVTVTILPKPVASAGLDSTIGFGASLVLDGSGGSMYSWAPLVGLDNPSAENPVCTPPATITYTLTVTGINGCSDTDQVKITLEKDYNLIIANMVTANGDGHNDNWIIEGINYYPNNEVHIYNRNGMEVFTSTSYHNEWNATWNGQQVPDGTYYYVLKFTDDSGVVLKGAITVVSNK